MPDMDSGDVLRVSLCRFVDCQMRQKTSITEGPQKLVEVGRSGRAFGVDMDAHSTAVCLLCQPAGEHCALLLRASLQDIEINPGHTNV